MARHTDWIPYSAIFIFGLVLQFVLLLSFKTVDFTTTVFILFLVFVLLIAARLRFRIPDRTLWIDALILFIIAYLYPETTWFILPFLFLVSAKGNFRALIIALVVLFVFGDGEPLLYVLSLAACLLGSMLYLSHDKYERLIQNNDGLRKRIYELELRQDGLMKDMTSTEQDAVMAERRRVSEMLHDDLGHELTGAHLALKAYAHLSGRDDAKAEEMLSSALQRLDRALTRLKETVHATEPSEAYGLASFIRTIETFDDYGIDYEYRGDFEDVPAYVWKNLGSTLKEGLTNIRKHARPTFVKIELISTGTIVRLSIENDGIGTDRAASEGNGLKYMRKRYEAVGGSLSVQKGDTFSLIVVLPIRRVT
ncbi:MAG: sensor histidine kinase [Acholeplasmataceae bacterium]